MTTFTIRREDTVNAAQASGWNMSFLGQPRLTIICGNVACRATWRTRDYYPLRDLGGRLTAKCAACGKWNVTSLTW